MVDLRLLKKIQPITKSQVKSYAKNPCPSPAAKPRHLICFKQWTPTMVMNIITSALNLKKNLGNTHCRRGDTLAGCKIMILQELNEPILQMAVSKAATLLGAYDVNVIDRVVWEQDFNGRFFSSMADLIFVSTSTHQCIQRFANQSTVPVMCMRSRSHGSIQSLATIMAVIEEFKSMKCRNFAFIGQPHPVLNSYLLLCPMLGANLRFLCSCQRKQVSPLLLHASEEIQKSSSTEVVKCMTKVSTLEKADVIIAGPTSTKQEEVTTFKCCTQDIEKLCCRRWIFFHTCPRGEEVPDDLFYHKNARTFGCFENMQFIAAALMLYGIKGAVFQCS